VAVDRTKGQPRELVGGLRVKQVEPSAEGALGEILQHVAARAVW
jgi:hypothetical protein